MKRDELIQRLVNQKLNGTEKAKFGCVPCFGRARCFADRARPNAAQPKK